MRQTLGTLAILALALPGAAGAAPVSVPIQRLQGVRTLFAAARADIEGLVGDGWLAVRVLASAAERTAALEEIDAGRRARAALAAVQAVARWEEFERAAGAVLGPDGRRLLRYPELAAAFGTEAPLAAPVDEAVLGRDRLALRMSLTGYPARLVADVLVGRITLEALEHARRLRALGRSEAEVAGFLEARADALERARVAAERAELARAAARQAAPAPPLALAPVVPRPDLAGRGPARWDATVVRAATRHGVDPDLVRAVIRHESAWDPAARSHKGALGLMQLMPSTAQLLGVDPLDPVQNIEGGTRYLAGLLAMFAGNLDAAILGYIGGPGYARGWLRGDVVPYGEVRSYLRNVKRTYLAPAGRGAR